MNIIGIDPGARGAIAHWNGDSLRAVVDMPTIEIKSGRTLKRRVVPAMLASIIRELNADHAYIELVGAMPGQGVSSMFAFGLAAGIVHGVVAAVGVPYTLVTPVQWKQALRVPAAKDGARARASQLMPSAAKHWPRVMDDGRAEAALIAFYGNTRGTSVVEW